ncbi:unnamed protein product, partial [Polarella glacialis]
GRGFKMGTRRRRIGVVAWAAAAVVLTATRWGDSWISGVLPRTVAVEDHSVASRLSLRVKSSPGETSVPRRLGWVSAVASAGLIFLGGSTPARAEATPALTPAPTP